MQGDKKNDCYINLATVTGAVYAQYLLEHKFEEVIPMCEEIAKLSDQIDLEPYCYLGICIGIGAHLAYTGDTSRTDESTSLCDKAVFVDSCYNGLSIVLPDKKVPLRK